ncbi:hypothetical protein [Streptomyces bacillaris]|uniref:hypothetical protein n=1 Tax=Streptomyces bacillaris TaxID=68179 RepID=UPI00345FF2A1
MPKKQPTAAKRARTAARAGAKYTTALRDSSGPHPIPPHLDLVVVDALPETDRIVVDGLRALAAQGGLLPVRVTDPDPEVVQARVRAEQKGFTPQWHRWASVEAAVDGYVLRETLNGPNRSGYTKENRGPRVPVPVRTTDGTVTVVAMPEWARLDGGIWVWAHTGWPVNAPGRIVDPPQTFSPAPGLRWEVAAWHDLARDGNVLGEDYGGGTSAWSTVGWCTSRADAQEVAAALTAHRSAYTRADVIEHGTDNGIVSVTRTTYLQAADAPKRPWGPVRAPGPRPASPERTEIPEPDWYQASGEPPASSLIVWTGTSWRTLMWTSWQTGIVADALCIGAHGPYPWAEAWGPRHPDRDLHDWTQEGRELVARYPDPTYEERTRESAAWRRAREEALVDALAVRGGLTHGQAAARLRQGGREYRTILNVGQATIARALNTARRELPEGPERTAVRHALDDLMDRHLLPADAVRIAGEQIDREADTATADTDGWVRRAVAEYITPAPDPVTAGVDGFRPQDLAS